ncbi:hypothetical protein TPR58_10975 [Sphingomonas sp. HF-S3]|uniref:Lipoprotein n=1 Tax=Sphingomonas rustica TaxID=3103142 RepID=A0ABV0B7Z7_9SPHN
MPLPRLPLIALVPALALAGCGAEKTTDNAMVDTGNAAALNDAAFNDAAPVVEDADDQTIEAVTVAAVPAPASGASAAESAPLVEAGDIEDEIRSGTGVQRIRHGDGWAWTRDGRIVRTADRDGGNVAYFRRGEQNPFLVQRDGRAYAYDGNRPVREFDRDGRGRTPDAGRVREAEEAAREARDRRERADRAREQAGQHGDRPDRGGERAGQGRDRGPDRDARPTPSPTPSATPRGRDRDRDRDGNRDRDRDGRGDRSGSPSPTPQPSDTRPSGDGRN